MGCQWSLVTIPNKEVRIAYSSMIRNWFSDAVGSDDVYCAFLESLKKGNIQKFARNIQEYLSTTSSYFDFNKNTPEHVFHVFMLGLLVGLRSTYAVTSNKESGEGRYDVLLIPKDKTKPGFVLEFKTCPSRDKMDEVARQAIAQIKDMNYTRELTTQGVTGALLIGLSFYGRECRAQEESWGNYEHS